MLSSLSSRCYFPLCLLESLQQMYSLEIRQTIYLALSIYLSIFPSFLPSSFFPSIHPSIHLSLLFYELLSLRLHLSGTSLFQLPSCSINPKLYIVQLQINKTETYQSLMVPPYHPPKECIGDTLMQKNMN